MTLGIRQPNSLAVPQGTGTRASLLRVYKCVVRMGFSAKHWGCHDHVDRLR